MSKHFLKASLLVPMIMVSGCSTARVVSIQPHKGGVIAVAPPQDPDARMKAEAFMLDNCGQKGFEIEEEGESVVGVVSETSPRKHQTFFGQPIITKTTTSEQKTEWRIKYKCK